VLNHPFTSVANSWRLISAILTEKLGRWQKYLAAHIIFFKATVLQHTFATK
jgi:hypothetical protein